MGDDFISEVTEPSVNAVNDSFGILHHLLNNLSAFLDILPGFWREVQQPVAFNDVLQDLRSQTITVDVEYFLRVSWDAI